jgi:hypothetical protein
MKKKKVKDNLPPKPWGKKTQKNITKFDLQLHVKISKLFKTIA